MLKVGDHVIYVDAHGQERNALVTIVWAGIPTYVSESGEPGCNVVIVADDAAKDDPYGRQIERWTSVVHKTKQPAHGNYWKRPGE